MSMSPTRTAAMPLRRLLLRLPAHLVNGIGVALGIALVQLLVGAVGGWAAALTASTGAILASLADVANTPARTWRRVLTAALVGTFASLLLTALRAWPVAVGVATMLLAFVSALALAWGPRAGPVSFVAVLALVFTMAAPPAHGIGPWLAHAGWTALGAAFYVGWSLLAAVVLQPRYRTLALAKALEALAELLQSRSTLLADDLRSAPAASPLEDWIRRQVALDERLQVARDLLFAAVDRPEVRRRIGVLLAAIELRDSLLASELDLELLGRDAAAARLRLDLMANLERIAAAVTLAADALRFGPEAPPHVDVVPPGAAADIGADVGGRDSIIQDPVIQDPASEAPLALALRRRAAHMADELARLQAALHGAESGVSVSPSAAAAGVPLGRDELQLFVSPEGWPLAALRPHATLASPVLRHAIRTGVALGCAYFLALALPWASHPHWLVLSVGVVLRGNLEQTLARRDARIAGTVFGCLLVLGLAQLHAAWLSSVVFLFAVAIAHAFITTRYLVTSAAASVMALLQAHLVDPSTGFGIGERLADTVLGALLAWAFSYMLPSWERRGVARLADRVLAGLRQLAVETLRWPDRAQPDLSLRLARREVYEAIGSIAGVAQRTGVEPERVRVPLYALATLLMRCHMLLAQLAAVRMLLSRHADRLDPGAARQALQRGAVEVTQLLGPPSDRTHDIDRAASALDAATATPAETHDPQPWLERRLQLAAVAAARVAQAAGGVRSAGV